MKDKTLRIITTPIVSATLSNVWHSEFLWERWGPYCCRCVLDTGILQLIQLILCLRIFESGCSVFTCFIASIFRLSTNHGHLSFISRTRLGDKYFSIFQRFLTWWYPDRTLSCTCKQFPRHIQRKKMNTQHIVAWASECFPDIPEFRHHAGSEVAPTWRIIFHYQATEQFEKWLRKWRLPTHLQQYWQYSLNFFVNNMDLHIVDKVNFVQGLITFPRELQLAQVQDLLALHTIQEPRYRDCIPQIISIARSFGHKWTRQQVTPFDWQEAVVAAFRFCAFHSNCNFATVQTFSATSHPTHLARSFTLVFRNCSYSVLQLSLSL